MTNQFFLSVSLVGHGVLHILTKDKGLMKVSNHKVDGPMLFISLVPLLYLFLNLLGQDSFNVAANLNDKGVKVILETHNLDIIQADNSGAVEGGGITSKQLGHDPKMVVGQGDGPFVALANGVYHRNERFAMDGGQFIVIQNMGFLDTNVMFKVGGRRENTEFVLGSGLVIDNGTVVRGGHFGRGLVNFFLTVDNSFECLMKKVGHGLSIFSHEGQGRDFLAILVILLKLSCPVNKGSVLPHYPIIIILFDNPMEFIMYILTLITHLAIAVIGAP